MLDHIETPIETLLRRRKPGFTLEAPFYTSQAIFDLDVDVIFGRHWIYIGVEPDIAEPGDAMRVDLGRNSVIIVRDDDMGVRAFHNVCRHRGARLITEEKTTVGNLVCHYHSWTYRLDGTLVHAEHMGHDFDPSCRGLKPVHIRSLSGLLFVCLAETPPGDFDAMAKVMEPYLAPHDIANTKVAHQEDLIEWGNWKLTMENNRECYHCAANHPELTVPLFAYGFGFAPEELDEAGRADAERYACMVDDNHRSWEERGYPSRTQEHLDDMVTGFRTERLPLDGAGEAHTLSTRVASKKLLGRLNDPKMGALHFWTQPNSWHHLMSDHIVTFSVLPLEPGKTLLRTKWLVHKDAVEGTDYSVPELTEVWRATNKQDGDLVGLCQRGAESRAYEPGPYSPHTEMLVERFSNWYVGRMVAELGV